MAKLFDFVECKGFYAKFNDGRYIFLDTEELTADLCNSHIRDNENPSCVEESCIETAEKTYYKYKSQKFQGVVVGFTDIVVKGYLDVVYDSPIDVGIGIIPEKFWIDKRPKETVKCAVVYYANNKKHYAPLEDIKVIDRRISK